MSEASEMKGDFRIGEWDVEPGLNRLSGAGGNVRLEPKVMEVLVALAKRPGEVVGKEELIAAVWADTFVTDDVLLRSISELRKALGDDAKEPRFIETITKRGYRLVAGVRPSIKRAPAKGAGKRVIWLWAAVAAVAVAAAAM